MNVLLFIHELIIIYACIYHNIFMNYLLLFEYYMK